MEKSAGAEQFPIKMMGVKSRFSPASFEKVTPKISSI
jgi:hypothetical protein